MSDTGRTFDASNLIVYQFSPTSIFVYDPYRQSGGACSDFFDVCESRMRRFHHPYIRTFPDITDTELGKQAIQLYRQWRSTGACDQFKLQETAQDELAEQKSEGGRNITFKDGTAGGSGETSSFSLDDLSLRFGISCFYHITRIQNLPGILRMGLLPKNRVKNHIDISNREIQEHRHYKQIPQFPHLTLHDCVPLFFAPKSPMLSALREQQPEIIYLHIGPKVLFLPQVTFTDGNARSNGTSFYVSLECLERLDWEILRADYWNDDDPEIHFENKRRRSAEVLVPSMIPIDYIRQITVMNSKARECAEQIVKAAGLSLKIEISPDMYFAGVSSIREISKPYFVEKTISLDPNWMSEPPPNFELNDPLLDDED